MLVFIDFMVLNITYPSPKIDAEIAQAIGPSYTLIERIRMKGIGSRKMILVDCSESIKQLLHNLKDTKYCNIEIRKQGIVVGFQSTLRIYAWVIPYYQLTLFNDGKFLTVYSLQDHIKMQAAFNGNIERKFLLKILSLKSEFLKSQDFR